MSNLPCATFKAELAAGQPKFGYFAMSTSPMMTYAGAYIGHDWVLLDAQHSPINAETLLSLIATIKTNHRLEILRQNNNKKEHTVGEIMVLVRVTGTTDRAGIQNALDCGADGVVIPYVNNAAELREAVSCCYYAPRGTRSFANTPCAFRHGLDHYLPNADKNVLVAFQVETQACLDNLEEIMAVPGADMAYLGPFDQSFSMGLYQKYDYNIAAMLGSPELTAAVDKLADSAKRHGKLLGCYLSGTARVAEFAQKGFTLITLGNDVDYFQTEAKRRLTEAAEAAQAASKGWVPAPSNTL